MSPITVTRVYWYTDWMDGIERALREVWRSIFGCHHKWDTVKFQHIPEGYWAVNVCSKCGQQNMHGVWKGKAA
jgi:hypothetical protein